MGARGGAWTDDQLVYAYNFSKKLAELHIKAIRLFHFYHVNASILRIEVSFLGVLADNMPTGCEWVSVALVVSQYMTYPNKGGYVAVGNTFVAKGINNQTIDRLTKDRARLEACGRFLRYY